MMTGARAMPRMAWHGGAWQAGERAVAEEVPVAFTYDGAAHAVMMATPDDLRDFALGFSLTEGIIATPDEIEELEVQEVPAGINLRLWLREDRGVALQARRRRMAGPVGCGMCGLETLAQARRQVPHVGAGPLLSPTMIEDALASLSSAQRLHAETRAVHAAGFWHPDGGLLALREDVGRHNALDKLAGALAYDAAPVREGVLVLSSRRSVELVQKAAMMGAALVVGVSAPTGLALEVAEEAGMTLIGIARRDGFEVFTGQERLAQPPLALVPRFPSAMPPDLRRYPPTVERTYLRL